MGWYDADCISRWNIFPHVFNTDVEWDMSSAIVRRYRELMFLHPWLDPDEAYTMAEADYYEQRELEEYERKLEASAT